MQKASKSGTSKSSKKRQERKKTRFLCKCFTKSSASDSDENSEDKSNKLPPFEIPSGAQKHEIIVTYQRKSYYVVSPPETSSDSIAFTSETATDPKLAIEFYDMDQEKAESAGISTSKESNSVRVERDEKKEKEKLVKTILGKYLEIRKAEAAGEAYPMQIINETFNGKGNNKNQSLSPTGHKKSFLTLKDADNSSSDSLEIIPLNSTIDLSKCKIDFPIKTKSAPTNFESYDSLADICLKLYDLRQEETNNKTNKATSCDGFNIAASKNNSSKKKMELVFTKSLDQISTKQDEPSVISLDYKISCEGTPIITGTLKTENILYQNDIDNFESDSMTIVSEFTPTEPDSSEYGSSKINSEDTSNSSLTWKLIISHHGRGATGKRKRNNK